MSKPESINWIPVRAFGEYPEAGVIILVSTYNPLIYGDQTRRVMEAKFNPYSRNHFVNNKGESLCVYAWAYKPSCMLNNN